jgi:hypothetical protein
LRGWGNKKKKVIEEEYDTRVYLKIFNKTSIDVNIEVAIWINERSIFLE